MAELPRSLPELEARFPDAAARARWPLAKRRPEGVRRPACGHAEAWELGRGRPTLQCAACERRVPVTAGAVLHGSRLPLRTRSLAAWLAATPKNGIPARQPWSQLGPGGHKSAWPLLREPRRATVDPEREPSAGPVEVDETSPPFGAGGGPARPGRSHDGRLLVAGAVEIRGEGPGPARGDRRRLGRGERRPGGLREAQGRRARPEGGRGRHRPTRCPSGPTSASSCSGPTAGATRPP